MDAGKPNTGNKRIAVAMSGGVDSSVAAALLRDEGHEVTGVFIITWTAPWLPCTWKDERLDAMRAATQLGIPFETVDLSKEYEREVVDYMVREYSAGRTPNPDVMCNKHVKFGAFLAWARAQGFDAIATGHYARIREITNPKSQAPNSADQSRESRVAGHEYTTMSVTDTDLLTRSRADSPPVKQQHTPTRSLADSPTHPLSYSLLNGVDNAKDQSYFLWTLTQEQLAQVHFPIGDFEKSYVRKLAHQYGLHTATKKDSQGVCFLGKIDMKEFLQHYIVATPGSVLDEHGAVIGRHDGAVFYTLGERHGFTTSKKTPHDPPLYVVSKDIVANTITVAPKQPTAESASVRRLSNVNWLELCEQDTGVRCSVRYRYHGELVPAVVTRERDGSATVMFEKTPAYMASGQSIVAYDGDICLGGGVLVA